MAFSKGSVTNAMGILSMSISAMDSAIFAMDSLSILRVCRCMTRPVGIAHEPAKVEPVIVRNLAPAFASLVQSNNVVETLSSGVSQQMRILQFTPAEPRRCPFRLQCIRVNPSLGRNSIHIRCARGNCAEPKNQCHRD